MKNYKKVLIIGGGQLGMMMSEFAPKYSLNISIIDPNKDCSASKYANVVVAAEFTDKVVIEEQSRKNEVITYEFENINEEVLANFSKKLPQGIIANAISKNRIKEKTFIKQLGYKTAAFCVPKSIDEVEEFIVEKAILKTTEGGYDGKGQYLIQKNDLSEIEKLDFSKNSYILEEFIDFDYEISVVATRDKFNNTFAFPVTRNKHKDQILFSSEMEYKYQKFFNEGEIIAKNIMEEFNYVGTFCIEFFVIGEELIINEMAPRPHNSGHLTQEGCDISQFEQHIKAIIGLKIERPKMLQETYMVNLIGENYKYLGYFDNEDIISHDYYKTFIKKGRKMAHINIKKKSEYEKIVSIIEGGRNE
ncbi:ATP-grasp domain-containing protein [Mycoplasma todarodis]|uniref:N5-carboxyaminoimidazole ribonucleotide synthase n=1 Tax=Mycoplasma todarodis TaxID=1937191 RepID=A0A4V6N9K1_9MOLU|nr:ATP-grasp domain-containing protein [Mycoplasma todarodis]TCG11088.1 5-(carboxyamino)imidazole ribonucleotide synthase [Mycoplasma todarodis]